MISLVIGLGNIGQKYVGTRHNTGFMALSVIAGRLEIPGVTEYPLYDLAQTEVGNRPVNLIWPLTLMNRSGLALTAILAESGLNPAEILVISDDCNLPVGKIRLRLAGSTGGHNGLESIIDEIGTENFPRLRMGIGAPPDNIDRADFVLDRFSRVELEAVEKMIDKTAEAVIFALHNRFEEAMTKFNNEPA